jgi:plasmid stabilization system protein ParE
VAEFRLSERAERDLIEIYDYTEETFGAYQADAYHAGLRRKSQMPDTPTFGRYTEIPHDQMTPEQQEGYRSLVETRGPLPKPTVGYTVPKSRLLISLANFGFSGNPTLRRLSIASKLCPTAH